MTTTFTATQLINALLDLPTPQLTAKPLSQAVFSILAHHQQSASLWSGSYIDDEGFAVTPHYWLVWHTDEDLIVDFRYPERLALEDGIRASSLVGARYQPLDRIEFEAIPLVLLPSFCAEDHAHFDHLAGK
ncbi:hypothetical protein [Ferrimonas lipolytica]|uniref:Uncharacterized protein n=1 Tax=Ferrimonas lipolytica TaxID=2724191 RepID=A0A6H1UDZ0_9GAMM|nr:hypothetical protein [Ferrimonas lipolytica]QIZ76012.1 hypothetical protein HER31_03390 [Ferrimonas lipolytica]